MSDRSWPYLARVGGGDGRGRTVADHLQPPGSTRFLSRGRGARTTRSLADHLLANAAPPVAAATAPPAARPSPPVRPAPSRSTQRVGEARESERRTLLDEDDPVVTLTRAQLPRAGRLAVVLEWDRPRTAGGVWSSTDVHLGALWQTRNGHEGLVQSTGSLRSAPGFGARQVLRLGARTEEDGEELIVDLAHLDTMRRIVLFAHGTRGAPAWDVLGVRLTITLPSSARIALWLGAPAQSSVSAVAASVHLVDGDVIIRREGEFLPGPARDVALAYGWDLDWSADGTVPRS